MASCLVVMRIIAGGALQRLAGREREVASAVSSHCMMEALHVVMRALRLAMSDERRMEL